jgi:NTE family protein
LHLGILKALEEFGIVPSHISGTNAGAITGAFYASYSIPEIVNILKKGRIFNFSNILIKRLFAMKGFHDIYKNFFPQYF